MKKSYILITLLLTSCTSNISLRATNNGFKDLKILDNDFFGTHGFYIRTYYIDKKYEIPFYYSEDGRTFAKDNHYFFYVVLEIIREINSPSTWDYEFEEKNVYLYVSKSNNYINDETTIFKPLVPMTYLSQEVEKGYFFQRSLLFELNKEIKPENNYLRIEISFFENTELYINDLNE